MIVFRAQLFGGVHTAKVMCLTAFLGVLFITECFGANGPSRQAIRALFDEDYYWISVDGADRLVEQAKRGGFTVIIPCVWHGRGAAWDSALAPTDDRLDGRVIRGRDPLRYLVERAAANGIEVHPWFTIFLRQRDLWPEFTDGGDGKQFDIHNIEFASRMALLVDEVISKYPVAGVNLDYVRALDLCASQKCQDRYAKDRGRNLLADIALMAVNKTARESIVEWQTGAVARAIGQISSVVRSRRQMVISADTIVGAEGWDLKGADGSDWLNSGTVDVVFHMDYRSRPDLKRLALARQATSRPSDVLMLVGNYQQEQNMGLNSLPRTGRHLAGLIEDSQPNIGQEVEYGVYEYRFVTSEQLSELSKLLGRRVQSKKSGP